MCKILLPLFLAACPALLAGDLTARYHQTRQRVLEGGPPAYTDELVLADAIPRHVRRLTEYNGDLSGRYLEAFSVIGRRERAAPAALDRIAQALLGRQRPDGHFGDPLSRWEITKRDMQMVWGQGRMLTGLLEYYELTRKPEVLQAATRLGDFLVAIAPLFNHDRVRRDFREGSKGWGYNVWTQNVEGLARLYRVTSLPRFRYTAEQMARRFDLFPAQHGDGIVTTLRGIVDLGEVTGDRRHLEQAEKAWQSLVNSRDLLVAGTIPEETHPDARRDEGCATSGWLRLNLALWSATRKPEYLEAAERSLFNAFAFNQFRSGDFGHHELTGSGAGYRHARAWWCCTLAGLRAFPDLLAGAFHASAETLFYDLPVDGDGQAGALAVRADSRLETSATVQLDITKADGRTSDLAIRQPKWAAAVRVLLEGQPLAADNRGGYLHVKRPWKTGEAVEVRYDLRTYALEEQARPNQVALFHGPWLLGVDAEASEHFFDEAMPFNRVYVEVGRDGGVKLAPAPRANSTQKFRVPVANFTAKYMPGQTGNQEWTVLLRPIAEHTAGEDYTPVEFWLRPRREGEKFVRQNDNF